MCLLSCVGQFMLQKHITSLKYWFLIIYTDMFLETAGYLIQEQQGPVVQN